MKWFDPSLRDNYVQLKYLINSVFPVPILAASDLIQALTLIIATFGFYSDFFITFDRSKTGGE